MQFNIADTVVELHSTFPNSFTIRSNLYLQIFLPPLIKINYLKLDENKDILTSNI